MGKENAINNSPAGRRQTMTACIISAPDKLTNPFTYKRKVGYRRTIFLHPTTSPSPTWLYLCPRIQLKTGRLCDLVYIKKYYFIETNAYPAKSKGWSSSVITISGDEDSDEEMAIFKQPGKKRKINSKHSVSADWIV